jgi:hypothetical protein
MTKPAVKRNGIAIAFFTIFAHFSVLLERSSWCRGVMSVQLAVDTAARAAELVR